MAGGSDSGDWRSHLTPQNRTRVYHKIMNCLMMNCRIGTPKELEVLQKIAVQFERRMYTSATSKDDYVRKISARLHCMEAHYQGTAAVNPSHPNPSVGDQSSTQSGINEWGTSSLQGSACLPPSISQQQSQDEFHFQKQIQNQLANENIQHHSQLNTHIQHMQQEQSFSQKTQLQFSQHPLKQLASILQSGQSTIQRTHTVMTQSGQQHNAQHEQQNTIQHSKPSMIQPCPQSTVGQHHRQLTPHNQSNLLQQQSNKVPRQFVVPLDQQQQFVSQRSNVQQQQQTHRRSSGQHHNIIHETQQMQMTPVPLHQQLGPLGNISTTKKNQLLGSQSNVSSVPPNLHPVHMLPAQGQRNQQDHQSPQQQMIPQILSHPQSAMQQNHKSLQRAMLQNSGATVHSHNLMEHQNQPIESQVESSTASGNMAIKITEGFSGAVESQEETYQKINFMKELYLAELSELHQKLKLKVNQETLLPPEKQSDQFEKRKGLMSQLDFVIKFLQISKNDIGHDMKKHLPRVERSIVHFLSFNRSTAPSKLPSHQQLQHNGGSTQSMLQQQSSHVPQRQQKNYSVASMQTGPSSSSHHELSIPTHVTALLTQPNIGNALLSPKLEQGEQVKQQIPQCQQQQKQQLQRPQMQQCNQQKQQQRTQIPAHQIDDRRHGSDIKAGLYQQHHHPGGQLPSKYEQLESSGSFPISSLRKLQASSPQITCHLSCQANQQCVPSVKTECGVPSDSGNSLFHVSSPSTSIALSAIPGKSEKISAISPKAQARVVATPGISASPLLQEFSSPDGSQSIVAEDPMDLLIKKVKAMPSKVLNCTIGDMISVLSFMHNVASSDIENSCRVAVNEDLAAMTECRLRAHKSGSQEKFVATKKMKREISATCGNDTDEIESTETSAVKRKKVEAYHAIVEEISKINRQLIDTMVSIPDEDGDSFAALTGTNGGIMVKFSFTAVSLSESFRSEFTSGQLSPIMPLRLLVPADYPKCSPVVLDKLKVDLSKESRLSVKAQMIFNASICSLVQPVSLRELARTWDNSVYKVIREYAEQSGGGSFSSAYGAWESCVAV